MARICLSHSDQDESAAAAVWGLIVSAVELIVISGTPIVLGPLPLGEGWVRA
jgi:hypothetical protein